MNSFPKEAAPPAYALGTLNLPAIALPPKAMTVAATQSESSSPSGIGNRRQLGYVVVSRPVRQGRLRLGLEEVLEMELSRPPVEIITNEREGDEEAGRTGTSTRGATTNGGGVSSPSNGAGINGGNKFNNNNNGSNPNSSRQHKALSHAPSTAALSDFATHLDARSDAGPSEVSPSDDCTTATSSMYRSLGSTGSLLQAAPVKRVSSGSSLATADGGLQGNSLQGNASRKLLLAEDNAINMKVALGILRRLGFTNVVTAPDGVAAVEAVAAAGGPAAFDAILMDLHMPKKGGIEAVQDILRAWPSQRTKIIAVTADAFEDTRDTCVANGFTGWLAKPFRVEEFAQIMGHL